VTTILDRSNHPRTEEAATDVKRNGDKGEKLAQEKGEGRDGKWGKSSWGKRAKNH